MMKANDLIQAEMFDERKVYIFFCQSGHSSQLAFVVCLTVKNSKLIMKLFLLQSFVQFSFYDYNIYILNVCT